MSIVNFNQVGEEGSSLASTDCNEFFNEHKEHALAGENVHPVWNETTKHYARKRKHSEDREDKDQTYTYDENRDVEVDFLHLSFDERSSSANNNEPPENCFKEKPRTRLHLTFISV